MGATDRKEGRRKEGNGASSVMLSFNPGRERERSARLGHPSFAVFAFLALSPSEANFVVQKFCLFKNIVPFYKIGPIGRARQALING